MGKPVDCSSSTSVIKTKFKTRYLKIAAQEKICTVLYVVYRFLLVFLAFDVDSLQKRNNGEREETKGLFKKILPTKQN